MKSISITVPATSANLGPGFDSLGLALDIVDTVTVRLSPEDPDVRLDAPRGEMHGLDARENLVCRAYRAWREREGIDLPGAVFSLESHIPVGRGFGSSAASIVAGLSAAAHAAGVKDARQRILDLGTSLEGHADNVAAALLGGMTVTVREGDRVHALHVANHLGMGVALFLPTQELRTAEAREMLPPSVSMQDAVFNLSRAAYLTTALIWGRWEAIGPAMQDRLHQPYRCRSIPALPHVIAAAYDAGAYGAALSGGGPAVIALTPPHQADEIAGAMERCAAERRWEGSSLTTTVREHGVTVRETEAERESQ